jgi:plasmid stabilization system protein ParE
LAFHSARKSRAAADQVEEAVFRACDFLADSPLAGRIRNWVVQPYSNYLIVYDPGEKPLQIIRILHSARDLPSLLP